MLIIRLWQRDAYCVVFSVYLLKNVIIAPKVWILPAVLSGVIRVGFSLVLSFTSAELLPKPLCWCFLSRSKLRLISDFVLFQKNSKRWLNVKEKIYPSENPWEVFAVISPNLAHQLAVYLFKACRTFNFQALKLIKLESCFLPAISYKLKFAQKKLKKQNTGWSFLSFAFWTIIQMSFVCK